MAKREIQINASLIELDSEAELSPADQELLKAAREVAAEAYAPYSDFFVGAAVRLENGVVVRGSNQENVAYNSGLCAERVAIFSAGANYAGVPVDTIAVTAKSGHTHLDKPLSPCGACRQVIAEYEDRYRNDIRIIMAGETGKILIAPNIKVLLPLLFEGEGVKRHF